VDALAGRQGSKRGCCGRRRYEVPECSSYNKAKALADIRLTISLHRVITVIIGIIICKQIDLDLKSRIAQEVISLVLRSFKEVFRQAAIKPNIKTTHRPCAVGQQEIYQIQYQQVFCVYGVFLISFMFLILDNVRVQHFFYYCFSFIVMYLQGFLNIFRSFCIIVVNKLECSACCYGLLDQKPDQLF